MDVTSERNSAERPEAPGEAGHDPALSSQIRTINLALQGGGAHGAFTWGVLDRLLDEKDLAFEGLSAPRVPGFRRIGAVQFFQPFLDREFGCFGRGKPHIQAKRVQPLGNLVGRRLPAELMRRPETISADREACFQCFRSGAGVR